MHLFSHQQTPSICHILSQEVLALNFRYKALYKILPDVLKATQSILGDEEPEIQT